MRKIITTLLISLSFILTMCSQQTKKDSDWNELKLKGNVKRIIEFSYPDAFETENGEIEKGFTSEVYYYLLNENRNVNEIIDSLSRECTDAFVFLYNEEGNLQGTGRFKARASYVGQAGATYEYDSNRKLKSVKESISEFMTMYGSKSISVLREYIYDSNNKLSEEINTITIDKLEEGGIGETMGGIEGDKYIENTTYVYNEKGQKVKENFYIGKKYIGSDSGFLPRYYEEGYKFPYEKKFTYDDKGRLQEETEKTFTIQSFNYRYSRENKVKPIFILTTYKYDEENRIQSKSIQRSIDEEEKCFYTYDEYGNIIRERHYKLGRISDNITYHYKYDKQGNWVEKLTYTNGELSAKNERTIYYY